MPGARRHRRPGSPASRTNLKPGDALLFVGDEFFANTNSNNWDFRLLDSRRAEQRTDRTRVAWTRGLGSLRAIPEPVAEPAGLSRCASARLCSATTRRCGAAMDRNFRSGLSPTLSSRRKFQRTTGRLSISLAVGDRRPVDLDRGRYRPRSDITRAASPCWPRAASITPTSPSRRHLCRALPRGERRRGVARRVRPVRQGDAAGARRRESTTQFDGQVRETSCLRASPNCCRLRNIRSRRRCRGDRMPVVVSADGLLPGRRLIVRGKRAERQARRSWCRRRWSPPHPVDATRCTLEITPPLPAALVRDSVVVHANVALASHGESVAQILGAGNASHAVPALRAEAAAADLPRRRQRDRRSSRARRCASATSPGASGRRLYGAAPDRTRLHAFDRRAGPGFRRRSATACAARGCRAASTTCGRLIARAWAATAMSAPASLTQLMTRPLGLKSVSNPLAAEGGTDPEPAEAARQSIPLTTRTLGRAVSLLDYEDFARAFSGIAKARGRGAAAVRPGRPSRSPLPAPVAHALTPASPVWSNLLAALKASGDPHVAGDAAGTARRAPSASG